MFQGAVPVNLDIKSRMAIPLKQRSKLVSLECNQITVTAHPHGCLLLYPMDTWTLAYQKMRGIPSVEEDASDWRRVFLGYADTVDLDASGRILLSPALRAFASIEKTTMLVGQGDFLELWNADIWNAKVSAFKPKGPPPAALASFSL